MSSVRLGFKARLCVGPFSDCGGLVVFELKEGVATISVSDSVLEAITPPFQSIFLCFFF